MRLQTDPAFCIELEYLVRLPPKSIGNIPAAAPCMYARPKGLWSRGGIVLPADWHPARAESSTRKQNR